MRTFYSICLSVLLSGLLTGVLRAEKFETSAGETYSGDAVSFSEKGVIIRLDDGLYADRVEWSRFTQESLKKFAQNPKAAKFVEAIIEPSEDEKVEAAKRSELVIKTDYDRLDRPAPQGLLKSIFGSGIGALALLLIYGANIYAGYEISIFRSRPPGLVCGVAAVLPILGPILFLCLPTQMELQEEMAQEPMPEKESYHVDNQPPEGDLPAGLALNATPQLPPTQTFPRGQFTFNRRFFETQFPGFFGIVKRETDKDMLLIIKSARGTYTANRITRLSANEVHVQANQGGASQEVMIPFLEIQEIILKHKNA